jgi:hypothetical protein
MKNNATDNVLEYLETHDHITPKHSKLKWMSGHGEKYYNEHALYKACRELYNVGKLQKRGGFNGKSISYTLPIRKHYDPLEAKEIVGLSWVEKFFNLFKR